MNAKMGQRTQEGIGQMLKRPNDLWDDAWSQDSSSRPASNN
jgi:hypothetical protein